MTIAVLRSNGDLIWFDAITQFSERYTGTVSTHPLESGNVVSDHTTVNNLMMSFSGIISDADFNMSRPTILDEDAMNWGISNKQFVNNSPIDQPVVIKYKPGVSDFLPDSIAQFVTPAEPVVEIVQYDRPKYAIRVKDELTFIQRNAETFSLVDFRDGRIWRILDNCILTSLDFTETPDSGDAIFPVMTIEQVRYATVKLTKIPKKPVNKGRKTGEKTIREEKKGDDPKQEPTNNSGSSTSESEASNTSTNLKKAD